MTCFAGLTFASCTVDLFLVCDGKYDPKFYTVNNNKGVADSGPLTVTSEDVCRNMRNVKLNEFLFSNMRFIVMFVTAVCVLLFVENSEYLYAEN